MLEESAKNVRVKYHRASPIADLAQWQTAVDSVGRLAVYHGCNLVIVDSWSATCGCNENDAATVNMAVAALKKVVEVSGRTVLATHHLNQSGGIRAARRCWRRSIGSATVAPGDNDFGDPRRVLESFRDSPREPNRIRSGCRRVAAAPVRGGRGRDRGPTVARKKSVSLVPDTAAGLEHDSSRIKNAKPSSSGKHPPKPSPKAALDRFATTGSSGEGRS